MVTLHFRVTKNEDGTFKTEFIKVEKRILGRFSKEALVPQGFMSLNLEDLKKDVDKLLETF